jgi:hypothetical protein
MRVERRRWPTNTDSDRRRAEIEARKFSFEILKAKKISIHRVETAPWEGILHSE